MKLADVKNQGKSIEFLPHVVILKFYSSSDYDSLQTMLHQVLHIVLMYGLREEEEGWRLWVESTATMHAYVSEHHKCTHEYTKFN